MIRISLFCAIAFAAHGAQAEMTSAQRDNLLSYYPCATALGDDELIYLNNWANATRQDPCQLSAAEFTANFGSPAAAPQQAAAADQQAIEHVQAYFDAQPASELFVLQVLIFGRKEADGMWGPMTERRLDELLQTYHAIGGIDDEWGVRRADDVPRFIKWIGAAEFAQAMGGEFPD